MTGIMRYLADCAEKALLCMGWFAVAFVIGAGLSMGGVWGAAYMLQTVQP